VAPEVGDSTRPDHPVSLMVVHDTLTPCETPAQGAGGTNGPYRLAMGTNVRLYRLRHLVPRRWLPKSVRRTRMRWWRVSGT
jgi:hypothetical protein